MSEFSLQKKAQCLRIYIGESDRWRGKSLETTLVEILRARGMAGATVFRGIAGFGAHSRIRSTAIEVLSLDLPIVIEVIDSPEKMAEIIEIVYPMVREGLMTLEDLQIIKYTHRYLNPLPVEKFVSELMTRNVVTITANMPVYQAWKLMLNARVKVLPVLDISNRVVGILTDEDLLERAGIHQRLSVAIRMDASENEEELANLEKSSLTVDQVMTHPVITVFESETLGTATSKMVKAGLKRLPVVNQDGKLVGMLSRLDILREIAHSEPTGKNQEYSHRVGRLVRDIMTTDIPMVYQDDDLTAIIEKFARSNSHRLIVVDSQKRAIGLLSDSDVVARIQPQKRKSILEALRQIRKPAPGKETAYDLMSPGPLMAHPELPVVDAVKKMLAESRKWLVVVDDDAKPLGLVDRQMLLEALIR
jgi:CBS domain-containing protein